LHKTPLAIYIHWPWCESKCPYCDFNSHVQENYPEEIYVDTLCKHIDYYADKLGKRRVGSIFFGGGTPGLMQPKSINHIVKYIDKRFILDTEEAEISMEANPSSSNLDKFRAFKNAGINRLSIGVQSFDDTLLQFLGRAHNKKQALSTIENAKAVFKNVSTDFIYGLPNQKISDWEDDLHRILDFDLQHLSCYQLTIEKQTAFYKQVHSGKWQPIMSDEQADFFDLTRETIVSQNMENYEISNFSKPNFECKHNFHVWRYQDYIGIGAGAHGRFKIDGSQYFLSQNFKIPEKYINNINKLCNFSAKLAEISPEESFEEMLMMGLRLKMGIPLNNIYNSLFFNEKFGNSLENWEEFKRLEQFNFIQKSDNFLKLTPQGWPMLDSVTSNLLNSLKNR
jgi:oxygen-independent coproporphyrinogen-3 oxidase